MIETAAIVSEAPSLITEGEVRKRFNLSRTTLWRWRKNGDGPRAFQLGPRRMYAEKDLAQWLEGRRAS